jgi:type 2 lantibiotic biosynthesis protein LanM
MCGRKAIGPIASITPGWSDPHRQARTVCRVRFKGGLTVAYKPRGLALDRIYGDILEMAGKGSRAYRLRSPRAIDRGRYGWSEWVSTRACTRASEAALFYRRQGFQLALLHLLCGTDFHAENIVAHGTQPVAVDLEGLASPGHHELPPGVAGVRPPAFSVIATGLLPQWGNGEPDRILQVSSAIGGTAGRGYAFKSPAWEGIGTDTLRLTYRYPKRAAGASVPGLRGRRIGPERYLKDIGEGFADGCRALAGRRQWLEEAARGRTLRRARSRCILRQTREYFDLLFWSSAPDQLTSGAAYDAALEMLWRGISAFDPTAAKLIDEEKASLWRGDVPAFAAVVSEREIRTVDGRPTGASFPSSALDQVRRRFAEMEAGAAVAWQQEIIRASLTLPFEKRSAIPARSRRDPLRAAAAIGDALERLAVRDEMGARWLDLARLPYSQHALATIVSDPWVHSGSAGTALFLARLARDTGEQKYAVLAGEALEYAWNAWNAFTAQGVAQHLPPSAVAGVASLVYALSDCGELLGDPRAIDKACAVALSIDPDRLRAETNPDLMSGSSGVVLALLRLHRLRREKGVLDRALAAAEAVLAAAAADGGWRAPFAARPLLGAAHGAAGIVCALDALDRIAPDPRYRRAVETGLAYERANFSEERQDWPNLQNRQPEPHFMTGWCAGAPGIGIVRVQLLERGATDARLSTELDAAIAATRRHLGGEGHHLCCGEAGRMLFLAAASGLRPELSGELRNAARALLREYDSAPGWALHTFRDRIVTPSLFSGTVGIGLAMLGAAGDRTAANALSLA